MKFYNTRTDLLGLVKRGSTIAEIGVFKGEFSKQILDLCCPKKLVLIDLWEGHIPSGDLNGNNLETFSSDFLYQSVCENFSNEPTVEIVKAPSNKLAEYSNDHFDAIYIDGDHSYEGVKADLEMSLNLVKNGGFIMGHDYLINPERAQNYYDFGVKSAVDEFCLKYGQRIYALALDGCVSFCIHLDKSALKI
jgi:hypothetical protein